MGNKLVKPRCRCAFSNGLSFSINCAALQFTGKKLGRTSVFFVLTLTVLLYTASPASTDSACPQAPAYGVVWTQADFDDYFDSVLPVIDIECCCFNNEIGSWQDIPGPHQTFEGCGCEVLPPEYHSCNQRHVPQVRPVTPKQSEDEIFPEVINLFFTHAYRVKIECECLNSNNDPVTWACWPRSLNSNPVTYALPSCQDCPE